METVALHIEYLLTRHDCVIVPGWGAFLVQYADAVADEARHSFIVPSRQIAFNAAVSSNDGLLINSIVRREAVSYEVAEKQVETFVVALKKQLDASGAVAIGKIGEFRKTDATAATVFTPYSNGSVVDGYFGLGTLKIKTIRQLCEDVAGGDAGRVAVSMPAENVFAKYKRFASIAASVAVMVVAMFVLSTPIPMDRSVNYASLGGALEVKVAQPRQALVTDGELNISLPASALCAEADTTCARPTHDDTMASSREAESRPAVRGRTGRSAMHDECGRYYLVVSSLDSEAQAKRFVAQHGDTLQFVEMEGHYRVYAAQARTMNALREVVSEYSKQYPNAWVCRK